MASPMNRRLKTAMVDCALTRRAQLESLYDESHKMFAMPFACEFASFALVAIHCFYSFPLLAASLARQHVMPSFRWRIQALAK